MSFNPQEFLESAVTGSNSTKIIPCPEGEYQGIINKILPRQWVSKDGQTSGVAVDVLWNIEDQAVKQDLNRDEVVVKQGIMLDIAADGKSLDMSEGKNVALGRLREAIGLNDPRNPFSFAMLPGQSAKVKVTHRVSGEDTYAEIKMVVAL